MVTSGFKKRNKRISWAKPKLSILDVPLEFLFKGWSSDKLARMGKIARWVGEVSFRAKPNCDR